MGEGLGGGEAAQLLSDRLMDAIDICQDFVVPKPQNAISLALQEPSSLGLPGRRAVLYLYGHRHPERVRDCHCGSWRCLISTW